MKTVDCSFLGETSLLTGISGTGWAGDGGRRHSKSYFCVQRSIWSHSTLCITTRLWTDNTQNVARFPAKPRLFSFIQSLQNASGVHPFIQPPLFSGYWVALSPGVQRPGREPGMSHLLLRLIITGPILSLSPYAFMAYDEEHLSCCKD